MTGKPFNGHVSRSACRTCGVAVTWAGNLRTGTYHSPLVQTGRALVIDDQGMVHQMRTFDIHHCDPDDVAALVAEEMGAQQREYDRRERESAQARASRIERENASVRYQIVVTMVHERGLTMDEFRQQCQEQAQATRICGKCSAKPGDPCINLSKRRRYNIEEPTKNLHADRWEEVINTEVDKMIGEYNVRNPEIPAPSA